MKSYKINDLSEFIIISSIGWGIGGRLSIGKILCIDYKLTKGYQHGPITSPLDVYKVSRSSCKPPWKRKLYQLICKVSRDTIMKFHNKSLWASAL